MVHILLTFIDHVSFQTYIWNIGMGIQKSINWRQGEDNGKISVHISGPTSERGNEVSLVLRQKTNQPDLNRRQSESLLVSHA